MIILPTNIGPNGAEPYFIDSGGWQVPSIGVGDSTRVDRLGDRHGISVSLPAMRWNDDRRGIHARQWVSRLKRGVAEGVRLRFPQPGFMPATAATATIAVNQVAQAVLVQITGGGADATLLEGMFVSLVRASDGSRFLHSVNADVVLDANGAGLVGLHPRLRHAPKAGDLVLLHYPEIDGRLIGDRQSWTLDLARTVGLQFEVEELP